MSSIRTITSNIRSHRPAPLLAAAVLAAAVLGAAASHAGPADRFAGVKVTSQHVSGNIYMLTGSGGNIGASVGPDGTLIIDDQYAPLAERILAALTELGGDRPKLTLNTHFHGDHTGSNAFFGTTATIVAHDNVRVRLLDEDGMPREGLPVVTFSDRLNLHFNDDEIQLIHLPRGHTDGDSAVWFKDANVIHMGDQLFTGRFPYIDLGSGGSVDGYLENLEAVLELVPEDIRVIPGHGELTSIVGIVESAEMIRATRKIVMDAVAAGKSAEQISLGERWASFGTGFINEQRWIQILMADAAGASPTRR